MNETSYKPMTVTDWILTMIILALPLVNIVALIIWAVSPATQPSKRTYAQASIILFAVIFVLAIVAAILIPLFAHTAGSV